MRRGLLKVIAAAAVFALAFGLCGCSSGVPEDQVKADVNAFVAEGIFDSAYVENDKYEVSEFKITESEPFNQNGTEGVSMKFEAKASNGSIEVSFAGFVSYMKLEGEWKLAGDIFTTGDVTAIPLKGVDFIVEEDGEAFETTYFESTLEEKDGVYFSTATQNVKYSYWFAEDTATNTQAFQFYPDAGWIPAGRTEPTDLKTTWLLDGKTLELTDWSGDPEGTIESSLVFATGEDGTLTAEYKISFVNDQSRPDLWNYHDYTVSGQLTGVPQKDFGTDTFTLELNDPSNGVTFECRVANNGIVAGHGEVNTLRANVVTDHIYLSSARYSGLDYPFEIEAYYSELL